MKKLFRILPLLPIFLLSICLFGCSSPTPFSENFTGVAGAFDGSGNLTAVLLFSGAEAKAGEITLKDGESAPLSFVYSISDKGDISFTFDPGTDAAALGTLHGYEIDVTATAGGKTYTFRGVFHAFTEKIDGEITEDGYVTAGHPLSDVVTGADPEDSIYLNREPISYEALQSGKMPDKDLLIEINKAE